MSGDGRDRTMSDAEKGLWLAGGIAAASVIGGRVRYAHERYLESRLYAGEDS